MPGGIIDAATTLLDPDEIRADTLLQDIRQRRDEAEAILRRAEETEGEAEQLRRLAARALRSAEEERRSARAEALDQAEQDLGEVREILRRLQRDRDTIAVTRDHVEQRRQETDRATDAVRTFRRRQGDKPKPVEGPGSRPILSGDRVLVSSLHQEGEVIAVNDGIADVQMGALKLRRPLDDLERLGRAQDLPRERSITRPVLTEYVPIELDIRGHRVAEVPDLLERYLERAYHSGLPFVRIIHGKGTGALREVVRAHLYRHPIVERHELSPPEQGGDGATMVHLREQ